MATKGQKAKKLEDKHHRQFVMSESRNTWGFFAAFFYSMCCKKLTDNCLLLTFAILTGSNLKDIAIKFNAIVGGKALKSEEANLP